jgi:farnesol dehydrogenase
MRVLLTGGTGYLGREIACALARRGHESVIFARSATSAVRDGVPGIPVDGDVRDAAALHRAAAGCEALCHAAAMVSVWRRNRREFDEVNIRGLQNAIAAATSRGLRKIIYTSSFLALPPSDAATAVRGNDYQRTKQAAGRLADEAQQRGVPLVKLYPGVIYGPGVSTEGNLVLRLVTDHLRGRLPGIIGGDRIWSLAFIRDVADAHVAALERDAVAPGYRLGGENLPQLRIFELLREATGRPLPRRLPAWLGRLVGSMEELRAAAANTTPLLTRRTVEIFVHDWAMDSTAAIRDLDYRITPFEEGFRSVLDGVLNLQT